MSFTESSPKILNENISTLRHEKSFANNSHLAVSPSIFLIWWKKGGSEDLLALLVLTYNRSAA
jgi:hypothetical protein